MTDMFSQEKFIREVYPLNRTLASDDTSKCLKIIRNHLKHSLKEYYDIFRVKSGTQCWTWTAPQKYTVKQAWIKDAKGSVICDFQDNALHLASYSKSFRGRLSFEELSGHLHSNPSFPRGIPWKFYYYIDDWAFCLSHEQFLALDGKSTYEVCIEVEFEDDYLEIGELFIPGKSEDEFLIVTNVCHPFQVNDSITGVSAVLAAVNQLSLPLNKSLRILFLPETIGSIAYFSQKPEIGKNIIAGMFTEMLGNENTLALQYSFQKNAYIDRLTESVLEDYTDNFRTGDFRTIVGNDELVTNGPGLNIPSISLSRSEKRLECYEGYHTSLDTPDFLNYSLLDEAAHIIQKIIERFNEDYIPERQFNGPVFLSGMGLWGIWEDRPLGKEEVDLIMYHLEGELSVVDIAVKLALPYTFVKKVIDAFYEKDLITKNQNFSQYPWVKKSISI